MQKIQGEPVGCRNNCNEPALKGTLPNHENERSTDGPQINSFLTLRWCSSSNIHSVKTIPWILNFDLLPG